MHIRELTFRFQFRLSLAGSLDIDLDCSTQKIDESHVSGVSPFFSSEDVNASMQHSDDSVSGSLHFALSFEQHSSIRIFVFSITHLQKESYYTCNSSVGNRNFSDCACNSPAGSISFRNAIDSKQCNSCKVGLVYRLGSQLIDQQIKTKQIDFYSQNKENLYKRETLKYPLLVCII